MKNGLEQRTSNDNAALSATPVKTNHLVKKVYRPLLVTMMLSILAFTIAMLIDSIITGNVLGSVALAAAGVVSPVYLLPMTIVGVLQIGSVALIMRYLGMEKIQKAVDLFTLISTLCVIIGAILTCVLWIFADPIAIFLGAKGDAIVMASDFIKGLALGMIPIMIGQYLLFMVRIDGHSNMCLVCVLIMAAVNVALDLYFSIVLKWGMFGMAMATSISGAVGAVICVVPFLSKKGMFSFKFYRSQREPRVITDTLITGLPTAVARFANLIFIIVINNILLVEGMAAFNVQNTVSGISAALYSGVAQTIAIMASLYYGEGDKRSIKDLIRVSLKSCLIMGVIAGAVFIIFSRNIVGIFAVTDPQIADMCRSAINMFAIGLPLHIAMYAITSYYQSVQKTMLSSVLTALFLSIMPIVWVFAFRPFMGNNAIWFSLSGGTILTLLVLPLAVFIVSKKFPKSLNDYMTLSMSTPPTLIRSMKTSGQEVANISKQIEEFCLSVGADQQESANAALAMREMAKNVVTHGYGNKDSHHIDIRVVVNPQTILMRIRDNAPAFDPMSYLAIEGINGGIQRVNAIAEQIDYKNTIGMNCLLVTILRNSVAK